MSATKSSSPTETTFTSNPPGDGSGNKLVIIVVSCIGGFLAALAGVCVLVPILRRRAARKESRDFETAGPSALHARNLSEAGAPLLSTKIHGHDSSDLSSYPPGLQDSPQLPSLNGHDHHPDLAQMGRISPSSISHEEIINPALYNSYQKHINATSSASSPVTAAPVSRAPHAPLRRSRTRIRAPMAPVPEDKIPSPAMRSPPLPPIPSDDAEHPSWLRVPSPGPLIGAFRRSVAASTSSRATSASSLTGSAHTHAFPTPARSSETFRTFTSAASSGHTPPPPSTTLEPEKHEIPARLRPSEPARIAQLVPGPFNSGGGPGSRAASLLSASGRTGSRSELSVYTDARSHFDTSELGERL